MRDRLIFSQLDLSFFGRQVKLFEVDLDFFLKFSQLVTNLLVSLLKTSPLKEDRLRRLVATNLFSEEDSLLACDWWTFSSTKL
jgi:hypothetical protein